MKMKLLLNLFFCLSILSCGQSKSESDTTDNSENILSGNATYYLVRHAEKDRSNPEDRNPHLTEIGLERANNWAEQLKDVQFDAVYSTDFHRTLETAKPIAESNGVEITIYDANNLFDSNFQKETEGKTVFVVGHSNTTPMFANAILGEEKYSAMDDTDNSGLYIVSLKNGKPANSELRQVKM